MIGFRKKKLDAELGGKDSKVTNYLYMNRRVSERTKKWKKKVEF